MSIDGTAGDSPREKDAAAPLSGLRVLEFGHIAAGPFAGLLLADLGADVVKVEPPEGDGLRTWPPIVEGSSHEGYSLNFAALNRNKRSVVADLKDPDQLARIRELCGVTDVIIENYRPGVLERLGLGFPQIAALREGIIYCSISGYGQEGRYARRGAFDVVVQGMAGLMSVTGEDGKSAVKCGVPVGDFVSGLYAAFSILAARAIVASEQRSVYLDCSMLDCLLGISALQTSEYWGTGVPPRRLGSAHPRNAPYQAFEGRDVPFIVAAGNDHLWHEVCEVVGKPELCRDPRFATVADRAKNQDALAVILQEIFRTRRAHEWLSELEIRGVPSGPVNTFADILNDSEVRNRGLIHELPVPVGGTTETVAFPVRLSGYSFHVYQRPPLLGEHTEEVQSEWRRAVTGTSATNSHG